MATHFADSLGPAQSKRARGLGDPSRAILGPRRDALLFWGAPLFVFLAVQLWLRGWELLAPPSLSTPMIVGLFGFSTVLTWAHLIAVVPRAYLNAQVFAAYRLRLTVVPIALLVLLLASPLALLCASVLAVFWDVHHSAMQNFGFARIYDMKAGNPPRLLRATDLRLNWALYVGPLVAGAALTAHTDHLLRFDGSSLQLLATAPGILAAEHGLVRAAALFLYAAIILWVVIDYVRAIRAGYRLPAHKLATLLVTGAVSILAWGFLPPVVALATINIHHAVQYFALVWVKEGGTMAARVSRSGQGRKRAALFFVAGCAVFGFGYSAVATGNPSLLLAPFIACSLLHFWYDGFVWSVRARQV